jgi:hypothetical protein
MKFSSCIPLRIHCWGGLGSQLYALSTAYDLKIKYPKRIIRMVLHTGGVTKRLSELEFIHNIDFEIVQVNDFRNQDKEFKTQIELNKNRLRRFVIRILYFFNFVVSANSDIEFDKVRPWTLSTRGHYFNRKVSTSFYSYLLKCLEIKKKPPNRSTFDIAIHYRMGDLLSLSTKSITPANKIIDVIIQIKKVSKNLNINVYSDSPQIAKETLIQAGLTDEFQVKDLPTIDVIRACTEADYFIGTGSKVSLWIVNIRRYMGEITHNYLEGFDDKLFKLH